MRTSALDGALNDALFNADFMLQSHMADTKIDD